ncbi:hypothetical protein BCR35DRAFT_329652 [Leucosporidium creatinivorum]|uniref:Transcription activator of gluconeogenesis ERT1 n=1 Tax=Leucosporidium creatinivorum TaxID=106004 RepID=A0A1Y2FXF0_9BASI|nr:hypothetical protein BCR35DRAFT_329652 [Leucosporidium creatinivorum]
MDGLRPDRMASTPRKKRECVPVACVHCKKAGRKCSLGRPCERCIHRGFDDCRDAPRIRELREAAQAAAPNHQPLPPPLSASTPSRSSSSSSSVSAHSHPTSASTPTTSPYIIPTHFRTSPPPLYFPSVPVFPTFPQVYHAWQPNPTPRPSPPPSYRPPPPPAPPPPHYEEIETTKKDRWPISFVRGEA